MLALGVDPFALAVVDVNGDGRLDLVIPNYSLNSVTVLLNTTGTDAGGLAPGGRRGRR